MNKELKQIKQKVLDFFFVYFDKREYRKNMEPQEAFTLIKDKLESHHFSHGRLDAFRKALIDVRTWQELQMNKD